MIRKKIFIGAVVLILSVSGFLHSAITPYERAALIAFYNAAGGDNWQNNSGWKDGVLEPDGFGPVGSEGTWFGITVTEDHVTKISITWNNLTGTLSPELGNLVYLESLRLGENKMTGSIPPELGKLENLETLTLFLTQMSGNIPPELGNLANLTSLSLSSNGLTGSIPPELGNLVNLTLLRMVNNRLTGSIPPELGKLDNLEFLDLGSNLLSSIPPELGNLGKLETLNLDNNQLSGAIPPELGNLHRLTWLNLQSNLLSGGIPPELGNLAVLEVLYLQYNQLTGTIPPELGNLSRLRDIHLTRNQLSGDIPPELGNLGNVEFLYLGENQLSGGIPPELGNLSRMTRLYLNNNCLGGNIPLELGTLLKMHQLSLEGNKLVGRIPSNFINFTFLYIMRLGYNGLYTDDPQLISFFNDRPNTSYTIGQTIAPTELSTEALSSTSVKVSWEPIYYQDGTGGYLVYYSSISGGPWTYAGKTKDKSVSSYVVKGLDSGMKYFIVRTQTDPTENNTNTVISEASEEVHCALGVVGPFGEFSTPLDGAVVSGSAPFTGWALDDIEVKNVKIYREQGTSLAYIGDALFVEGARPDIEQAYPGYPNNSKAGWGYMMLTNFLPNFGNGTFKIHAVAQDAEGHHVTLGIKTITCDNANAVNPFGAIDTPYPGETTVGSDYRNQGWVLTPMPNMIPVDGSTISVFVDGVFIGHPTYNEYREDIAALFPGNANSDGAWAYLNFDTTLYTDGVHTIYWTAEDDAGNCDGIGSRHFSILNSGERSRKSMAHGHSPLGKDALFGLPVDYSSPVGIIKGYNTDGEVREIYPDENGNISVDIGEVERIKLDLFDKSAHQSAFHSGCLVVGDQIKSLPIGSTVDKENGVFYWQPGPGFIGEFKLLFVIKGPYGGMMLKKINIRIHPGRDGHSST